MCDFTHMKENAGTCEGAQGGSGIVAGMEMQHRRIFIGSLIMKNMM